MKSVKSIYLLLIKKATIEDSYSFELDNGCKTLVDFARIFRGYRTGVVLSTS